MAKRNRNRQGRPNRPQQTREQSRRPPLKNELSRRHVGKIGNRDFAMRRRMTGTWSVAFLTRGKSLLPLGTAAMMVQCSWIDENEMERIQLACFHAEATEEGVVYQPRMRHAFERTPVPNGGGAVLDPRDPGDPTLRRGDHPNGEWVRWGLDCFSARQRAAEQSWDLKVVPKLPEFLVALATIEEVDALAADPTDALKIAICRWFDWPEDQYDNMIPAFVQDKGRELLRSYATAPDAEGNTTGKYLVPMRYVKVLKDRDLYENFAGLMDKTSTYNFARDVRGNFAEAGVQIANPTDAIAWFDTQRALKLIREADVADEPAVEEIEMQGVVEAAAEAVAEMMELPPSLPPIDPVVQAQERIMELLPKLRAMLGVVGEDLTDEDLMDAMDNPSDPIVIPVSRISERFAVSLIREQIEQHRPHILFGVTEYDMLQAWRNPNGPLPASLLAYVQVLRRDPKMPLEDALSFGPSVLGDRIRASFFVRESWRPRGSSRRAPRRSEREAATTPAS